MRRLRVNDYDMAYIEVGQGRPLVCVHGSIGDFRTWSSVLGPLSRAHRVIAVSLRHFFPEQWDGVGGRYTIAQHVSDVIAFVEALEAGPVDLMGHSRGGHIAFRVAQQRTELVRRLVLAEPGGELDGSLQQAPPQAGSVPSRNSRVAAAAEKIAAGDIDGALQQFIDNMGGAEAWARLSASTKQEYRDNARRSRVRMRKRSARRRCSSVVRTRREPYRWCCALSPAPCVAPRPWSFRTQPIT
jgi:pimeloyl-ACP methyl ester carboxylesterase